MMNVAELEELGDDIVQNGMHEPLVEWIDNSAAEHPDDDDDDSEFPSYLLDGRNRLEALDRRGLREYGGTERQRVRCVGSADYAKRHNTVSSGPVLTYYAKVWQGPPKRGSWQPGVDPWVYVASANLKRRHLTAEQRQRFVAAYLKAHADHSDRKIAAELGVSHQTVGRARATLATGPDGPVAQPRTGMDHKTRRPPQRATTTPPSSPRAPDAVVTPGGDRDDDDVLGHGDPAAVAEALDLLPFDEALDVVSDWYRVLNDPQQNAVRARLAPPSPPVRRGTVR